MPDTQQISSKYLKNEWILEGKNTLPAPNTPRISVLRGHMQKPRSLSHLLHSLPLSKLQHPHSHCFQTTWAPVELSQEVDQPGLSLQQNANHSRGRMGLVDFRTPCLSLLDPSYAPSTTRHFPICSYILFKRHTNKNSSWHFWVLTMILAHTLHVLTDFMFATISWGRNDHYTFL